MIGGLKQELVIHFDEIMGQIRKDLKAHCEKHEGELGLYRKMAQVYAKARQEWMVKVARQREMDRILNERERENEITNEQQEASALKSFQTQQISLPNSRPEPTNNIQN